MFKNSDAYYEFAEMNFHRLGIWNRNVAQALRDILWSCGKDLEDWGVMPDGECGVWFSSKDDDQSKQSIGQLLRFEFEKQCLSRSKKIRKWNRDKHGIIWQDTVYPYAIMNDLGWFKNQSGPKKMSPNRRIYRLHTKRILEAIDYIQFGKKPSDDFVIGKPLDPIAQELERQKNLQLEKIAGDNRINGDFLSNQQKMADIENNFFEKYKFGYIFE